MLRQHRRSSELPMEENQFRVATIQSLSAVLRARAVYVSALFSPPFFNIFRASLDMAPHILPLFKTTVFAL